MLLCYLISLWSSSCKQQDMNFANALYEFPLKMCLDGFSRDVTKCHNREVNVEEEIQIKHVDLMKALCIWLRW